MVGLRRWCVVDGCDGVSWCLCILVVLVVPVSVCVGAGVGRC